MQVRGQRCIHLYDSYAHKHIFHHIPAEGSSCQWGGL